MLVLVLQAALVVADTAAARPAEVALARGYPTWLSTPTFKQAPARQFPITVLTGLHLHDVIDIRLREQDFVALTTLTLQWNDPRLRYDPATITTDYIALEGDDAKQALRNIWHPATIFYNTTYDGTQRLALTVYPDGFVCLKQFSEVTAAYRAELRAFPFDRQTLRLVVAAFDPNNDVFRLAPLSFSTSPEADIVPAAYRFASTTSGLQNIQTSANGFQRTLVFEINIDRQSRHYILRYFIPLFGLLLISWTTYLMTSTKLHDRLKVIAISLLTIVTFVLYLNQNFPRVPYVTALGLYFALCSLLPFVAIVQSIIIDRLDLGTQMDRALRMDRVSLWAVPLAYAGIVAIVTFYALWNR
ncbi:MAG: hypothetical protein AAFX81_17360 [Pseudomonadota bacterium]